MILEKVEIGGKASNLKKLDELGMNVPKWTVISASVLAEQNISGELSSNQLSVPVQVQDQIKTTFGSKASEKFYAVRSSAVGEDGIQHSYAGLFETYLNVPFDEINDHIIKVWSSINADRVSSYRTENKLEGQQQIGVIIQEMIDADIAGVAFGIDPVTGDDQTKVVSSVFGLGEALVSGQIDADTFHIGKEKISSRLVAKDKQLKRNKNGSGVEYQEVSPEKQLEATLNESQLSEIAEILEKLNNAFGSPQDIEFAYLNNELFLLQTRPVTAVGHVQKGEYIIWDNSNIIESYPGITSPLTYTFIIKMYEMVYRQLVGLLGVSNREIEKHKDVFANTLGHVCGRVYYNLLNWYKMLAMLPGYSLNAENMETMMGVKERFELKEDFGMNKGMARIRILFMVFRMIWLQLRLPGERRRFMRFLNQVMREYEAMDFQQMSLDQLNNAYRTYEKKLLLEWKAPMINDFFAMIWFGSLKKKTQQLLPNEPNIHNDLLCGSQDIISVEPVHRSLEIARLVADDIHCKEFFLHKDRNEIYAALASGQFPKVKEQIDSFIERFGYRCVGELKLETVSYKEDPSLFIQVIKSYVEQDITRMKIDKRRDEQVRNAAEEKIAQALKGKPIKKWVFNFILRKAREHVSSRENLRYERTRAFGMVRMMFTAMGKRLFEAGRINDPRDVFYLEMKELLESANPEIDLSERIAQRKKLFETYQKQEDPQERFYTYGNDFSDTYIYSNEKLEDALIDLQGIGCCPGKVRAKVRVVKDPREIESLNGDILVTSSTDPGWVTLFPTASAIIVERGSLLSHSAIVSREMGIPCIVGVTGLLRSLKSGDMVEMDGSTGAIKVISDERTAE